MIVIDIDFTTKQITATTTNDLTLGTGGGGAGGGVESVTGDLVNNTDPLNPIINTPTLNEVLAENNETDGEDILITDGDKILLDNGANLKKGTTDAGLGGSKGIALRCAVDYELKWEAGRLYVMGGDGFTIREVSHNFTTSPTVNDDNTKGFIIGSRWILDDGTTYECTDASVGAAVWVAITAGAVTSVGLTMPSAFTVANSPITSSGDIAVTGAGLVSQYVRGDGSLANFPASTGGGASQSFYLNGSVSQGTFGGVAFKEMDRVPILGAGTDFTINTNGYIQSFITDANVPNLLEIPAGNWNFETYFSASSGGGSPSFYLELYKWNGSTLSLIASNSATPEGITGGTAIDLYISALAVPQTALLATDRLAIRIYVNNSGRTITLHTENNHLCQVITTFSTGITALNGLTDQVQNLSVGTSGTDFAISSATGTHTFNLPTASAANRGALSSADWTAFNGKQNTLVSGINIKTINSTSILGSGDINLRSPKFSVYIKNNETLTGSPFPSAGTNFTNNIITIPANTLIANDNIVVRLYFDKTATTSGTNTFGLSIGTSATQNDRQNALVAAQLTNYNLPAGVGQFWVSRFNLRATSNQFTGIGLNAITDITSATNVTTTLGFDFTQPLYLIPYIYNASSTIILREIQLEIW